jgi:hypothetical protein
VWKVLCHNVSHGWAQGQWVGRRMMDRRCGRTSLAGTLINCLRRVTPPCQWVGQPD